MFSAENRRDMEEWIEAISKSIAACSSEKNYVCLFVINQMHKLSRKKSRLITNLKSESQNLYNMIKYPIKQNAAHTHKTLPQIPNLFLYRSWSSQWWLNTTGTLAATREEPSVTSAENCCRRSNVPYWLVKVGLVSGGCL